MDYIVSQELIECFKNSLMLNKKYYQDSNNKNKDKIIEQIDFIIDNIESLRQRLVLTYRGFNKRPLE